ncbi:MAG: AAA domain-containing protein [bacterium]
MSEINLQNYLKYCLGYLRLTTRPILRRSQDSSVTLPGKYFSLERFLIEDDLVQEVDLPTFNEFSPLDLEKQSEEIRVAYEEEKKLAMSIEALHNKFKNDEFTKELKLNFGFYRVSLPQPENEALEVEEGNKETLKEESGPIYQPLFSIPVSIERYPLKKSTGYKLAIFDTNLQVLLSPLEAVLGEALYYDAIEEIGKLEVSSELTLPTSDSEVLLKVWEIVRSRLKNTEALFDDDSFSLDEIQLALVPRVNYFLTEDLLALTKMEDTELEDTSLLAWASDDECDIDGQVPSEGQLYFPFVYDKYQLHALSVLDNRCAVIHGPPGTGKSQTISNLLCHLAAKGNKVLFVSQKPQALKVVKDRLRDLNIKYLFGYIPNPASKVLDYTDEQDGIAAQLANIEQYITALNYGATASTELEPVAREKAVLKDGLNGSIDEQRLFTSLEKELEELSSYSIEVQNANYFKSACTPEYVQELNSLITRSVELQQSIQAYSAESKENNAAWHERFGLITEKVRDRQIGDHLLAVYSYIEKSGFDGHGRLARGLSTIKFKLALSDTLGKVPREIRDYIDEIQKDNPTKHELLNRLESFNSFFDYYCNQAELSSLRKPVEEAIVKLGLKSFSDYQYLNSLLEGESCDLVVEKVLKANELRHKLSQLGKADANKIAGQFFKKELDRRMVVAQYLRNIISQRVKREYIRMPVRGALARLSKVLKKSKRAFKTFAALKNDPETTVIATDLVPIWLMELDDASRLLPLQKGLFDYVIFDEASQCNIAYALPAMFRAKKAVFVGDPNQMRDDSIKFKTNRSFEELALRYGIPQHMNIKPAQDSVQSVLDIAKLRGFRGTKLLNHYRSPRELIGFSNHYFYDGSLVPINTNYLTYQDTNRVMLVHEVSVDMDKEVSDDTNYSEALAIAEMIHSLREDEKYAEKSIGVLTFFNAQAELIRRVLEENNILEDRDNVKVAIIEGIQGDEKDIVLYSFAIKQPSQKRRYVALTGEGGEIAKALAEGRVNVAFSRGKLQVHCFTSMPVHEFPEGVWIKKYLQYVEENGEISFYSQQFNIDLCDSKFEIDFFGEVLNQLGKDYIVQNQIQSCGFRLDFVVTNSKNNKKIAIECDGPTHFKDELDESLGVYVESDEEREAILRSAGWEFYRVKYSDWTKRESDTKKYGEEILKLLQ